MYNIIYIYIYIYACIYNEKKDAIKSIEYPEKNANKKNT